jgi:hypothetical protein
LPTSKKELKTYVDKVEKEIKDECKVMWRESVDNNGKERSRMSQNDKEKALSCLKKKLEIILK